MTVLIPEAVGAVGEAATAAEGATGVAGDAASATARGGAGMRAARPKTPAKRPNGAPPVSQRRSAAGRAKKKAVGTAKKAGAEALKLPKFSLGGESGSAHKIVVAEFVLCVVLVGLTPVLMRNPNNGHVYIPNDFVRLSAVCVVFFVLALLSNTPKASKVAAMFGALVTLGVIYNASQSLSAIGSIFVNAQKNKGNVTTASAGTATFETATYTPGAASSGTQPGGTVAPVANPNPIGTGTTGYSGGVVGV